MILMAILLTFSFSVDAAQVKTIKSQSLKRQELQVPDDSNATDDEDNDDNSNEDGQAASPSASPVYEVKGIKMSKDARATRLELVSNLRKQSHLKEQIEHLTDKTKSDEEIEAAAKLVANETESVQMADMLADMWKDMRMFDVPAYEKHVRSELHKLKQDEKALEAKLKGSDGDDDEEKTDTDGDEEKKKDDTEKEKDDGDEDKRHKEEEAKAVKAGHDDTSFVANFWAMNRAQQKSTLTGSIVYLIGGVLVAVIFKQMRSKYFKLEDSLDGHPSTKGFSFPAFGCIGGDLKLFALGFCCPCLAWANTVERRLKVPYWQAFLAFFGLMLLNAYTMGISFIALVLLGVFYRQKLRTSYEIESFESGSKSTVAMDFLLWCFCQPCAIIQEAREETATRYEADDKA